MEPNQQFSGDAEYDQNSLESDSTASSHRVQRNSFSQK